jgi:aminopeptidase N
MWVHEGFTNYSEVLFTQYYYGKEAATEYISGIRKGIGNKATIIGKYGVNKEGSGDMYSKGANMLHTIRQVINNDSLFRKILRGLNKTFYHQTVTTKQIENYISTQSKINFSKVFDQYLRNTSIPVLEYKIQKTGVMFRYVDCIKGFNMPLKVNYKGQHWIKPTGKWQTLNLKADAETIFSVNPNFYIFTKKVD